MSEYVKDFVAVVIVISLIALSFYMFIERPDSDAASKLLVVDIGAFTLVLQKLFK